MVWRKQLASLHKIVKQLPELSPNLQQATLVCSEIIHFFYQLAYYVTVEVMEYGWDTLVKDIDNSVSLDEVISAHQEFLNTFITRLVIHVSPPSPRYGNHLPRALLDDRSREVHNQLRAIYDRILEFEAVAARIHEEAVAELEARVAREGRVAARTREGEYGT